MNGKKVDTTIGGAVCESEISYCGNSEQLEGKNIILREVNAWVTDFWREYMALCLPCVIVFFFDVL